MTQAVTAVRPQKGEKAICVANDGHCKKDIEFNRQLNGILWRSFKSPVLVQKCPGGILVGGTFGYLRDTCFVGGTVSGGFVLEGATFFVEQRPRAAEGVETQTSYGARMLLSCHLGQAFCDSFAPVA